MGVLEHAAYGGCKDARAAWAARVLAVEAWSAAAAAGPEELAVPEDLREAWAEAKRKNTRPGGAAPSRAPPSAARRLARPRWMQ